MNKIEVPVSRTNFNRYRFGIRSIVEVLTAEKIEINGTESTVLIDGRWVNLGSIELVPKEKQGYRPPPKTETVVLPEKPTVQTNKINVLIGDG